MNNPNATEWEIIACTSSGNPGNGPSDPNRNPFCYPFGGSPGGGTGLITVTGTPDPNTGEVNYTLTGLDDGQQYTIYVRAVCGPNDKSAWQSDSDALQFQTIAIGSYCSVAKDVQTLPYTDLDQMNRFGSDDYSDTPGSNCNSTSPLLDGLKWFTSTPLQQMIFYL
ncbi:hypothetical protein ACFSO9_15180 [Mesonia maritima]|uniref:hypothetical protein n=1 Tax=Mesonia maritima TaxID=1793873 RepID=UPI00364066BD